MNRNVLSGVAPRSAAVSSNVGSSNDQRGPTMRSTTATLNTTCAHRIPATGAVGRTAFTPVAMTTAGIKNGTVMSPMSVFENRNECRETAQVIGNATATVSTVDSAACHAVNHQRRASEMLVSVDAMSFGLTNEASMVTTGNAKNTASAMRGMA